jgi:hypothetical protein
LPIERQLVLVDEAVHAICQLTASPADKAKACLLLHLPTSDTLEDAAAAACGELAPEHAEVAASGLTFVERLLGRGVRPATIAEMAARQPAGNPSSSIKPANLNRRWDQQLTADCISSLPHAERARLAHRHASDALHDEALRALTSARAKCGGFSTPTTDSASDSKSLAAHPNSAVRMAAKREDQLASSDRNSPVVVVTTTPSKPQQWKQGAEKDQKGFFWSTKQSVQQAWESANRLDGEHSYRTFKSLIHQNMISVICFEIGVSTEEYEKMTDSDLLCRIDAILKPKDSTEYFLKLSSLRVEYSVQPGTLGARYRAFSEPFIETLAEATASGMPVNPEQARAAFKSACCTNNLLKLWLSEQKWKSVAEMHQRVVRGLKQYDTDTVLRSLEAAAAVGTGSPPEQSPGGRAAPAQPYGRRQPQQQQQQQQQHFAQPQQQQQQQQQQQFSQPQQQQQQQQFSQPQQQQQQPHPPAWQQQQLHQHQPAFVNNTLTVGPHPGLDSRGQDWHENSALLGCRTNPCSGPFCQVCGAHGHRAEECKRKRHARANLTGYFSEQRPGIGRLQYDGPVMGQQQQQQLQPQRRTTFQDAQPARPPAMQFAPPPSHYAPPAQVNHGLGAPASAPASAPRHYTPVQRQGQGGSVNHQASQSDTSNSAQPGQQSQQHPQDQQHQQNRQ